METTETTKKMEMKVNQGSEGAPELLKMIEFTKPEFGNHIIVSYEGEKVGHIFLSDFSPMGMGHAQQLALKPGQFMLVNYTKRVHESVTQGVVKYFSDIVQWKANPPLKLYRVKHFI